MDHQTQMAAEVAAEGGESEQKSERGDPLTPNHQRLSNFVSDNQRVDLIPDDPLLQTIEVNEFANDMFPGA